jgi:hypothetical protein
VRRVSAAAGVNSTLIGKNTALCESLLPHPTHMPYSPKTIYAMSDCPKTLGNQLGRWAATRDFSVVRVAKALGVTRQTVYNWFFGGEIFPAYEPRVEMLLNILKNTPTADEAWKIVCKEYNLTP